MFIFDTDLFTLLEFSSNPARERLLFKMSQVPDIEIYTSIITYEEQTRGWMAQAARARTTEQQTEAYRKLQRHLDLYRRTQLVGFDKRAGEEYDRLKLLRLRIGTMDLKIAAIALSHNATLLTRNYKDFRLVPNLHIEDWSS
jgi:tRNA(fMet)-specific endonuclease VapC